MPRKPLVKSKETSVESWGLSHRQCVILFGVLLTIFKEEWKCLRLWKGRTLNILSSRTSFFLMKNKELCESFITSSQSVLFPNFDRFYWILMFSIFQLFFEVPKIGSFYRPPLKCALLDSFPQNSIWNKWYGWNVSYPKIIEIRWTVFALLHEKWYPFFTGHPVESGTGVLY